MPIYIVRESKNADGMGWWGHEQNFDWVRGVDGYPLDCYDYYGANNNNQWKIIW